MKMSNISHAGVIHSQQQGLGQYTHGEMLAGLSWLAATDDDVVTTLAGLGTVAAKTSVMDAIISNAAEMKRKQLAIAKGRNELAQRDPKAAMQLMTALKKTSAPGTSVARAVIAETTDAAKKAMVAKADEKAAKTLLAQNDKRAAAAKAVAALTAAREAIIKANTAERTRLTAALDSVANTLEQQAKYVDGVIAQQVQRSGPTPRTDALRASAENLRAQAKKLRAESAVVAQAPVVPANAPDQKRIADVANRFNIRTARWTAAEQKRALISVLSDITDDPLAQVTDYDGALQYYGNDNVGRLMADIEYGNKSDAFAGLSNCVHHMGYVDTTPVLAKADRVLAKGVMAAQRGYVDAVVPAYVGHNAALPMVQKQVAGLAGLGALAGPWEDWCDANVPGRLTGSAAKYNGDVAKCKNNGKFALFAPWDQFGLMERGVQTFGDAAAAISGDVIAGKDAITGGAPKPGQSLLDRVTSLPGKAGLTLPGSQPPPATQPPKPIPGTAGRGGAIIGGGSALPTGGGFPSYPNAYTAASSFFSSPKMVVGGVAVAGLLGFGIWKTMLSRPRA